MAISTVLDVGSTKVTCLVADPDNGEGFKVLAVGTAASAGVKRGVVTDAEAAAEAISSAISQVEEKLGSEVNDLMVSINGGQVEGSTGRGMTPIHPHGRAITREDVLQVHAHSRQVPSSDDRELLHAMPIEYIVDGGRGLHSPIGMPAGRLEVVTFTLTAKADTVKPLDQAVALAGKRVGQFVAGPLASGMGVLTRQDLEQGGVCIDIGGGKTDISVFIDGSLVFCCCIPVGSGHVTSDIAHLIKTSFETAESLKVEHGAATAQSVLENEGVEVLQLGQIEARPMQRRVLCEIVESRMREIANLAKTSIEKSGQASALNGSVAITGGGSLLPGTADLFGSVLGVGSAHLGRPVPALPAMAVSAPPAAAFAAAVGLARFAFESYENELAPASGGAWKSKVRSLWSLFGSKT